MGPRRELDRGRTLVKILGVILIVLGIVALAYQGITYTTSEKVVDLGPLKVEAKKEKTIPLPPIVGAAAVIGGVVLVMVSRRR
jgi:uncharacterized membrane protein HdeD (DUF308 family)